VYRSHSAHLIRVDLERAGCDTQVDGICIDFHAARRSIAT
jgi:hypothetical protein